MEIEEKEIPDRTQAERCLPRLGFEPATFELLDPNALPTELHYFWKL